MVIFSKLLATLRHIYTLLTLTPLDFPTDMHHSAENACDKQTIRYTTIKLNIKLFAIHKGIS